MSQLQAADPSTIQSCSVNTVLWAVSLSSRGAHLEASPKMHIPVLVPFMCELNEQDELDAYEDEASDGSHIAPGCKRRPSSQRS